METITQELADYVEQRVKEALLEKEEQLKKLEMDKVKLIRMASELKNDVKNMKVTISMFEKRMCNPARKDKPVEHKCVGCDFRINPSPSPATAAPQPPPQPQPPSTQVVPSALQQILTESIPLIKIDND